MTQLEDDDALLNNLLKFPGTIIIYNNDLNTYNYVLNGHNSIPLSVSTMDGPVDLNDTVSINVETIPSCTPPGSPAASTTTTVEEHTEDTNSASNSSIPNESSLNITGNSQDDHEPEEMDDDGDSEPELTNLSWLTELKNITNLTPSDVPLTDLPTARFNKFIAQVRRSRESYDKRKEQYTSLTNSAEKPPFNYAQIIAMAMLDEGRMTLKQICKWIQEKFTYYKVHKNWNNSIRHNLSLSFYFTKVSRAKDEKGKGGYWELSMDVSKSEKKRIRVRHRNKGNSAGSSIRSRNRVRKTPDDADMNADLCEKSVDNDSIGGSIDGNNNNSSHVAVNDQQMEGNLNGSVVPSSTVDSSDNASSYDTGSVDSGVSDTYESPAIVINEDQLIKTSNLVDGCAFNFDSIINTDTGTGMFTNMNVDEIFSDNEIPQPANDDIIVPFFSNNGHQTIHTGPNVIVETIPYFLPDMVNFDEQDFGNLININEQEISDEFLNEHGFL
ncbi:uncharacterized protein LOC129776533 [Toxorhynchites rutilus septentrionalis]|uniref:uncharacterized protein LOC129776533 n=1 Tax=Toxorhynchites rutilus septentrionalis TaxID=329112 RepID=UPI00247915A4|nr:uncharacterized protein LOC129776533 [Toxorhynchites rutilus septentrionalis]